MEEEYSNFLPELLGAYWGSGARNHYSFDPTELNTIEDLTIRQLAERAGLVQDRPIDAATNYLESSLEQMGYDSFVIQQAYQDTGIMPYLILLGEGQRGFDPDVMNQLLSGFLATVGPPAVLPPDPPQG